MLPGLLPSLFHRRLLLIAGLSVAAFALPAVQLVRLTTLGQAQALERLEARLELSRPLPTTRGRILDRKQRVLAASRPSYDLAIDYPVLSGQWTFAQAAKRARRIAGAGWATMPARERERLIQEIEPEFRAQLDEAWATFAQLSGLPRAELDARRDAIVQRVVRVAAAARAREQQRREQAAARGESVPQEAVRVAVREENQPHVLLHGVEDRVAFAFLPLVDRGDDGSAAGSFIPGLRVLDTAGREYPYESVDLAIDRSSFPGPLRSEQPLAIRVDGATSHVVGQMRSRFTDEDEQARAAERQRRALTQPDAGRYLPGDPAGRSGIERSAEFDLRGLRGSITQRTDSPGESRTEPTPGRDIPLTIDVMLQARVQALLDPRTGLTTVQPWHGNQSVAVGQGLAGAAVVLDVATGELLALVSSPTFTREQLASGDEALLDDPITNALTNRAISKPYPPGSIVKPLIYAAAVTEGLIGPDFRVACNGHFLPNNPRTLQCWIFKQFQTTHAEQLGHDLSPSEALMVSCNIYFYTLGRTLGPRGIIAWYNRLGVGPGEGDLGIGPQFAGIAGESGDPTQTSPSEAILMGIGQGPVAWTPLHAADAFATLARGGQRVPPRLRADQPPHTPKDLRFETRAVALALEGLRAAARNELGTAHHVSVPDALGNTVREPTFNAPRVEVWAKSGTADAPAILSAGEPGQRTILRDGDHSWLVCLVAPQGGGGGPKYAIAVVVDYGGSGGKVAGPVANQIIHALIAEGYL
jgi:penicillin-binding protein 2